MVRKLLITVLVILLLTACFSGNGMDPETKKMTESQGYGETEDRIFPPEDALLLTGYYVGELERPDTRKLEGALLTNDIPNGEAWAEASWDLDTICIYHELDRNFIVMGGIEEWAYLPRPFFSCILRKDTGETAYCVFYYEEENPYVLRVEETAEPFDFLTHMERIQSRLTERGVDASTAGAVRGHCYDTENNGTCEGILLLWDGQNNHLRLFYNFEGLTYRGVYYPPFSLIEQGLM